MHAHCRILYLPSWLLAITVLGTAPVSAQVGASALIVRLVCINHGSTAVEPIGDGEGQSLLAAQATCQVQGGPMDGAVETQHNLWHYDKATGTLLSGHSVARKPGAISTAQILQGMLTFQMTDGRVTGWSSSGRARTTMAVGAAAPLAGRLLNWTATASGPRSYTVQLTYDP